MDVAEYIPLDPAVADRIILRKLPCGAYLLIFAFDEGDGPRVTAKVLVSKSTLLTFDARAAELREDRGETLHH